jgi:hypothetical protein
MYKHYACYEKNVGTKRLCVRSTHLCPGGSDLFGHIVCNGYQLPYINFGLYYDNGLFEGCPSGIIGCEEMVNGVLMPVFEIEDFDSLDELIAHCCNPGDNCYYCAWPMKVPQAVKVTFSGIEYCGPCIQANDSGHTIHVPTPGLLNGSFLLPRSVQNPPSCSWELCLDVSIPWTRYAGSNCSGDVYSSGTLTKFRVGLSVSSTQMNIGMSIYDGFTGMGTHNSGLLFSGSRALTSPRPRCINTDVHVNNGQTYCYFHVLPNNTFSKRIGINGTAYVEYVEGDPFPAWTSPHQYEVGDGVTVSDIHYCCYVTHTSDISNRPGTGANWQLYWDVVDDDCGWI